MELKINTNPISEKHTIMSVRVRWHMAVQGGIYLIIGAQITNKYLRSPCNAGT